jgi:hypothetical protein
MPEFRIAAFLVAFVVLLVSVSDFYKGVFMVVRNQHRMLFIAQVSFWLLSLLPVSVREDRYSKAMNVYTRRRKLYGVFALVGGIWGILLSFAIILNS